MSRDRRQPGVTGRAIETRIDLGDSLDTHLASVDAQHFSDLIQTYEQQFDIT